MSALRAILRLGPLNPIAVRLVEGGSRRARHMTIRSAYLGVLILVLLWVLLAEAGGETLGYRELAAAGARAFEVVAYLQIGLICVLSPVFMAGAISQESSPRTWEVLLTTPISPAQVVLGNLLGRLYFVLAMLVAALPLFALTQYFGGVPGTAVLTSSAIAACAALFVGAVAIALATSRVVGRRAVFTFYVAVVSYLAVSVGIDVFLRRGGGGALSVGLGGVTYLTAFNPFLALRALLEPSAYARADVADPAIGLIARWLLGRPVASFCLISVASSVVLLAGSSLTVRLGGLGTIVQGRGGVPWYRRLLGLGGRGSEHRPPREVGANPISWRESSARNATLTKILTRWSFVGLGLLFGLGLVVFFHAGGMSAVDYRLALQTAVLGELAVATLVAVNMSATAVTREREDGTLDLLLTTPLTPSMYLSGKLRGLIAYLAPMISVPVLTLAAAGIGAWAMGSTVTAGLQQPVEVPVVLPEAALLAPLVVGPFIALCVMVGLLWSLRSKGTLSAVVATVVVVGLLGLVTGLCGWLGGQDVSYAGAASAGFSPASLVRTLTEPEAGLSQTFQTAGLGQARIWLAAGCVVSCGLLVLSVWLLQTSMAKNFDFTVRKLAGSS
ncbi:MAG: ABC transporter permease subunit [Planctomycetota bacterium]